MRPLTLSVLILILAAAPASAKTKLGGGTPIDRPSAHLGAWFPSTAYENLSFVADGPEITVTFEAEVYNTFSQWTRARVDNVALVTQATWDAHVDTLAYSDSLYASQPVFFPTTYLPHHLMAPGDFLYFSDFEDSVGAAWDTTDFAFFAPEDYYGASWPASAPNDFDTPLFDSRVGGGLGLGRDGDATVTASTSITIGGLTPGESYVLSYWSLIGAGTWWTTIEGTEQWTQFPDPDLEFSSSGGGAAWVDYDLDGDPDLHVTSRVAASVLLRNDGGTDFVPVPAGPLAGSFRAATWADYDKDGDPDAYCTADGPNVLARNDGGVFVNVATGPLADPGTGEGATWFDMENDGDLDLFFVNAGGANRLLRNDGRTFIDVTPFPMADALGYGTVVIAADYNGDGYQDIFFGNSNRGDRLFENSGGGSFTEVGGAMGLGASANTQGACWGDADGDLDLDLYIAQDPVARYYRNDNGTLVPHSGAGLDAAGSGRGANFADVENDGDLDAYLTHNPQEDVLSHNGGSGSFSAVESGPVTRLSPTAGEAWADFDKDGDLDVYVVSASVSADNRLYRNDSALGHRWLQLDLVGGASSNRSAVGAHVRVVAGGQARIREVRASSGYRSQNALTLHFGLGSATRVDSIIVKWPSGACQETTLVTLDQCLTLTEAAATTSAPQPEVTQSVAPTLAARPNPTRGATRIHFELQRPETVSLYAYDLQGRLVRHLLEPTPMGAGRHEARWDGYDDRGIRLPAGLYLVHLIAGHGQQTVKIVRGP